MFGNFNMGVGFVLVVHKEGVDTILKATDAYVIGELVAKERGVTLS